MPCEIVFVAMAPGLSEDDLGFPTVGPTRPILDFWIEASGVSQLRWAVQNLIACMSRDYENPTKTRDPTVEEIISCRPRLIEVIELLEPGQVVLLGELAQRWFPKDEFRHCQYLDLIHPAALLRSGIGDKAVMEAKAIARLKKFAIGG